MKTFIKTIALALTLGVVTFAQVAATTLAGMRPTDRPGSKSRPAVFAVYQSVMYPSQVEPVINVIVRKEEGSSVQIRIRTKSGETLAERSIGRAKDTVAMKFRLSDLPDGMYRVEITNGRDVTTKEINLNTQPQVSSRTIAMGL